MKIAKVAVAGATYAIDRPYSYRLPKALEARARPGMRVLVPFGRGDRKLDAILLVAGEEDGDDKLKEVLALLDDEPVLDEGLLRTALWMRERYFCTVYEAARAILPSGLWFSLQDKLRLAPGDPSAQAGDGAQALSAGARKLLAFLEQQGGEAQRREVRAFFGAKSPAAAISELLSAGLVTEQLGASRLAGDKKQRVASLALPPEEALAWAERTAKRSPARLGVVERLCSAGELPVQELCYDTGASLSVLQTMARHGILTLSSREVYRRPRQILSACAGPAELNDQQRAAYERLRGLSRSGEGGCALLYGVTGSGKTQVYLKLIADTLSRGRTAMILVPEIALTPQLMALFTAHFGDEVAILHSSLSVGERYDEWKRLRAGKARLAVGTRSAVFAPLDELGLIILDEEQEPGYKSEQAPRYHAREVARYRAHQSGALVVLGSATPSVESMFLARSGKYALVTLPERYNARALPQVSVVDMRRALRGGSGGVISPALARALAENLSRGEQSILFLNRRGASRITVCGECGYSPECPQCSVHLTYHSANHRLMCHYCGYSQPLPERCPECGGLLDFLGAGTQRVEEELAALFPGTPVLRMDADTVAAKSSHELILDRFQRERIPILVGTQMVAKGLDFGNVTLVGVLDADQALYVEDFRAGERTFSLLTQVVGRAGRADKPGRALIQTYAPEHEVIQAAARQDYDGFYEKEIRLRRARRYAPFSDLFVITASGTDEAAVLRAAARLRQALSRALGQEPYRAQECRLLGPAPAPVLKVNSRYRYRLTLNARSSAALRALLGHMLRQALNDKKNRGVSLFIDSNPLN